MPVVEHVIVIRPEAFGIGFDVVVEPQPAWGSFACERRDHRSAKRCADHIRIAHGWPIRDETGEKA